MALTAFAAVSRADLPGADPGLSGAPGESTCTGCHTGTAVNSGGGSVQIQLPGDRTYTPGVTQRIKVVVADTAQRRWGFELSARAGTAQAGDLASVDTFVKAICANGRSKPCANAQVLQYVTHTQTGTRLGTTGSATFEFNWTPPSASVGTITLYASGNAANGDGRNTGDHIYTTNVQLEAAASAPKPTISSDTGVVNGASFQANTAPGGWTTIKGTNLASTTRTWTAEEVASGKLPTSLDGVSVTINNKPAFVQYISPTQINVVAPADDSVGPVEVKVTSNGQTSDAAFVTLQKVAPAFFTFDGKFVAATHVDNTFIGKTGLFTSAPNLTTPAKPGETIILYGSGFGATDPAITSGQLTDRIANVSNPFTITIGGVDAAVSFAGLVPPYAQLYQFNVQVPAQLADGDHAISAQMLGNSSPKDASCCFVTVQK
ncbi:MAG: choice-of-anchor V domain-containing protein [Bryobacteraceae bacterium]